MESRFDLGMRVRQEVLGKEHVGASYLSNIERPDGFSAVVVDFLTRFSEEYRAHASASSSDRRLRAFAGGALWWRAGYASARQSGRACVASPRRAHRNRSCR